MGKHLEWLTVELEKQAQNATTVNLAELIEEARCHVVSSQEALMELGLCEEDAEREAVQRFGSPAEFVRQLATVHRPKGKPDSKIDVPTFVILSVAMLFTIYFICLQYAKSPAMWIGWAVFATLAVSRMWKVKRFQWELVSLFVPASVILGVIYPMLYFNPTREVKGGASVSGSGRYRGYLVRKISEDSLESERLRKVLAAPDESAQVSYSVQPGGYIRLSYPLDGIYTRQEAHAELGRLQENLARNRTHLNLLEVEMAKPLWIRILMDFRFGALFGLGWVVLILSMNFVVWGLHSLYDALARIGKRLRQMA